MKQENHIENLPWPPLKTNIDNSHKAKPFFNNKDSFRDQNIVALNQWLSAKNQNRTDKSTDLYEWMQFSF